MRIRRFRRLERHRTGGARVQIELSYLVPRSRSGKLYQFSPNPEGARKPEATSIQPPCSPHAEINCDVSSPKHASGNHPTAPVVE